MCTKRIKILKIKKTKNVNIKTNFSYSCCRNSQTGFLLYFPKSFKLCGNNYNINNDYTWYSFLFRSKIRQIKRGLNDNLL